MVVQTTPFALLAPRFVQGVPHGPPDTHGFMSTVTESIFPWNAKGAS